jgi:ferrous iron transport protein A
MRSQQVPTMSWFRRRPPCQKPCLACVEAGRRVRVVAIEGQDALARRLGDHGLWPGALVELVTTAPGGDPLLFRLHGFRLALRRDEAQRVLVAAEAAP